MNVDRESLPAPPTAPAAPTTPAALAVSTASAAPAARIASADRAGPSRGRRARCPDPRWSPDRGGASVLVLAMGLVLVTAGLGGAAVGAARVGRHQARSAADLGALAGAIRAVEGERVACDRAAVFVAANRASVRSCRVEGLDIVVVVEVVVTPLPGLRRVAQAAARAGPVASAP